MAVLALLLLLAATAAGKLIVARLFFSFSFFYVVPFGQSASRSCLRLYARSAKLSYVANAPAAYWVQRVIVCLSPCRQSVRVLSQHLLRGRGPEASVCAGGNGGGLLWAAECEVGPAEGDRSLGQLQQLW